MDRNQDENKSKSKSREKLSLNNLTSTNKINAFNQKNYLQTKSNHTTINTTTTTLSQRSNHVAKSQLDNNPLNSRTIESEVISTHEKFNLTTEGNIQKNNKRLTLLSSTETLSAIDKMAKLHLSQTKPSKSPVNSSKTIEISNRSISPSLKQQLDKINSIKKVIYS